MPDTEFDKLSASKWADVRKQRARLYGWFSTLYAREIPKDTLASYLADDATPFVAFAFLGLDIEVRRIQAGLDGLRVMEGAHLELAAEFPRGQSGSLTML